MDAKSIYEELLKQGIPEKLVTWSNKADSIDILIQDYNEKVYKEALKFFKGYKGVRVDYTIDHETALWCDDVSKYSSDELIRSITDFYYTLRAKGLAYTESKESARKSIKESNYDINNTAYFDRVARELHSWYVCYVEDYKRKYEYGFKNEKECINWIKKNGFDLDPSMIESKKTVRKFLRESDDITKLMKAIYKFLKKYGDYYFYEGIIHHYSWELSNNVILGEYDFNGVAINQTVKIYLSENYDGFYIERGYLNKGQINDIKFADTYTSSIEEMLDDVDYVCSCINYELLSIAPSKHSK